MSLKFTKKFHNLLARHWEKDTSNFTLEIIETQDIKAVVGHFKHGKEHYFVIEINKK